MRAIGFDSTGGPEVLREVTLPTPVPGPGEVLIRIAYAGVNSADVQHRRGEFGPPTGFVVPGLGVSGHVETGPTKGEAVTAYLPGLGGYAEFAVAPAASVHPLPAGVDLLHAGAVGCVLPTAYGLLTDAARIRAGETVLVHAAANGVGSVAARLARALGAKTVLGTVGSPDELAYASDLGYDDVFVHDGFAEAVRDYTQGRGVDIVLDPVGGPSPFGRVVGFDGKRQPDWEWTHAALELLAADRIRLDISSVLSLQDAALAHERLESGTSTGKILLRVD